MMRISEPLLDMEMANYSEVLDPSYTSLEFETMQVLYNGSGEFQISQRWDNKLMSVQKEMEMNSESS